MARLARLLAAHVQYLSWDGNRLELRRQGATHDTTQELKDWTYYMSWGIEDRKRLARRVLQPFRDYMKKEISNWNSQTSESDVDWNCFLLDMHYELDYALSLALSLPSTWFGAEKKE